MKFILNILITVLAVSSFNVFSTEPSTSNLKPLRLIALAPHIVEMLFEIGAGEQIVGAVEYADHPEQALKIPRVGGYYGLQIEKLLALEPDIVFVWQSGNSPSDIEQIKRLGDSLGIKVVYSKPKDIEDVATELRLFGKLLGRQQQAEIAARNFEVKLANIKQKYLNKKAIKVFYQLWSEPMMTINDTTWIHQLVEVCQGENVFAKNTTAYPQISIENVMVMQPQVIILPNEKAKKPQPIIAWHKWPEIPAVAANAFISVNADLLHRFSTRMLDGVKDMCEKIEQERLKL